jgi:hypothetical protein
MIVAAFAVHHSRRGRSAHDSTLGALHGYFSLALAMVSVIGTGCTSVTSSPPAALVEAPTLRIGDRWLYTDNSEYRVIGRENSSSVIEWTGCKGCRYYHDRNLTVIGAQNRQGKEILPLDLNLKWLDFPLFVGKQWDTTHTSNTARASITWAHEFAIDAYEPIRTKAGTFTAFRIWWTWRVANPQLSTVANWMAKGRFWYSPEVRAIIKREEIGTSSPYRGSPGLRAWDRELESYSLAAGTQDSVR